MRPVTPSAIGSSLRDRSPIVGSSDKYSLRALGIRIVAPMVEWVLDQSPSRVIDAGCGSGRFTVASARRAKAQLVAIDTDPLSTLATRAALAAVGVRRATVICGDYTQAVLPPHDGKTANSDAPSLREPRAGRAGQRRPLVLEA